MFPSEMADPTVCCYYCGSEVEQSKCRLLAKGNVKFKCTKCVRVDVQVDRNIGTVRDIREWPLEAMQAFYKEAAAASSQKITQLYEKTTSKYKQVEEFWEHGGSYLPLSVWQNQGWDIDRIKANSKPEDVRFTSQGGEVYRVRIMSAGNRGVQGDRSSNDLMASGKPPVKRKMAMASEGPAKRRRADVAKQELPDDSADENDKSSSSSSSSDASSSSSSSSEKRKKHKKQKKSKKEKKKKGKMDRKKRRAAREQKRKQAEKNTCRGRRRRRTRRWRSGGAMNLKRRPHC